MLASGGRRWRAVVELSLWLGRRIGGGWSVSEGSGVEQALADDVLKPPSDRGALGTPPGRRHQRAATTRRASARERGARASGVGLASAHGPKGWPRPVKVRSHFSFINKFFRFSKLIQIQILKMKMTFSQVVRKIKVVQNLILYNFHLGHF
jgi:hypothetical protein